MSDLSFSWRGNCRDADPELFVTSGRTAGARAAQRRAVRICRGFVSGGRECPVLEECRRYALDHEERYGVWGGMTEAEREVKFTRSNTCAT